MTHESSIDVFVAFFVVPVTNDPYVPTVISTTIVCASSVPQIRQPINYQISVGVLSSIFDEETLTVEQLFVANEESSTCTEERSACKEFATFQVPSQVR